MKSKTILFLALVGMFLLASCESQTELRAKDEKCSVSGFESENIDSAIELKVMLELSVGSPMGQLHAIPVKLGKNRPKAFLAVYCADSVVDPYVEMFFFPTDTLKFMLFTEEGKVLWKRELGRGVVPGGWFCPVYPFDLNSDGVDEIWFVNNPDDDHPLGLNKRCLERIDAATGKTMGQWPWPKSAPRQHLSHTFRNFILGGYVKGEPVLVTAQGTYGPMKLQGWKPNMTLRWEYDIDRSKPGASGSHMCPVIDINNDGIDEILWGERCIGLDTGRELFCADRDVYQQHSDVIQPVYDRSQNRWFIYTCREGGQKISPRVVLFNDKGRRVWSDVDYGHMDIGWVARIGENGEHIAMAIRIGSKTAGPKGFFRQGMEEFSYKALTGEKYPLRFSTYKTLPVDLNGDGIHELVKGADKGMSLIIDGQGKVLGKFKGSVVMASKLIDHPGEQLLCYRPDGMLRILADANAKDNADALWRYNNPFYKASQALTASGSNRILLGGL
ncbi:MAG: hypothetical protein ACYS1A_12715 [Planctomycetota bacterium]|jgi:hypothetical protein